MVLAGSLIGARLSGIGDLPTGLLWAVALSNSMLFSASVCFNDWHDFAEDSLNKPRRSIVSGQVPRRRALTISVGLFAAGVGLALAAGGAFAVAAPVVVIASVLYTMQLKGVPFVGNALVALVSTYAIACWMLLEAPGSTYLAVSLGCMAFRMGAEILKTSEDVRGDGACGLRTVATVRGAAFANHAGLSFVSLGLLCMLLPVLLGETRLVYQAALAASWLLAALAWLGTSASGPDRADTGGHLVVVERAVMVLMIIGIGLGVSPMPV